MAAPLYFLADTRDADVADPTTGDLNVDALRSLGIAGPFADLKPGEFRVADLVQSGPGGAGGCLFEAYGAERPAGVRFGYYADAQDWHKITDRVWIGVDKLSPVRPVDIARQRIVPGDSVRLADGESWTIPKIRTARGSTELPFEMWRDATGAFRRQVAARYGELWEWAGQVFGQLTHDGAVVWELAEMLDYCTAVLSINYRFDFNVQRALRLIDSTNWKAIVASSVDYWTLYDHFDDDQKKTLADRREIVFDGPS